MDCSEYVSRILVDDGLLASGTTLNSKQIAELVSNEDAFVKSNIPQEGDIAVWEGHVGIVTSVNEEGNFKLSHARGDGKLSAENSSHTTVQKYRKSTFLGFYHPRVEDIHIRIPSAHIVDTYKSIILTLPKYVQIK